MNTEEAATMAHDSMGCVQHAIKRATDIVCSLIGLIVLSPVYLIIYILMKSQHDGPVFFLQERIGYKGRPFTIYKFRTMSNAVESDGPHLMPNVDDSNSTRLEQFLRSHHRDELPQVWNVLRGDMSLAGPRPERKYFIDKIMQYTDRYPIIYEMRPGLTSEATLYNGYTDTMGKMLRRLEMDIHYLEHRSIWTDFMIVVKTVLNIISGKKF